MNQLPRPLKQVLNETTDASVVRTWARLQRTRRIGRQHHPMVLVAAGLAAMVISGLITTLLRLRLEASNEASAAVIAEARGPSPSVSAILAKGRQASTGAPRSVGQPLHVATPNEPEPVTPSLQRPLAPPDPVGALLDSASEAVRASKFTRAATLLAEVADHHAGDRRSATALYALGRLQLDNLRQPAEARRSFTRALELNPPEDLVVPLWKALEEASPKTSGDRAEE